MTRKQLHKGLFLDILNTNFSYLLQYMRGVVSEDHAQLEEMKSSHSMLMLKALVKMSGFRLATKLIDDRRLGIYLEGENSYDTMFMPYIYGESYDFSSFLSDGFAKSIDDYFAMVRKATFVDLGSSHFFPYTMKLKDVSDEELKIYVDLNEGIIDENAQ